VPLRERGPRAECFATRWQQLSKTRSVSEAPRDFLAGVAGDEPQETEHGPQDEIRHPQIEF
jgi:hypothetical protein